MTTMKPVELVDCDVHPTPRSLGELLDFVAADRRGRWIDTINIRASSTIYIPVSGGQRADAKPEDGTPAGSDPELLAQQLFGDAGVDIAILLPMSMGGATANPEHVAAIRAAVNDWLSDTWLSSYGYSDRLRGSIYVSMLNVELAVEEIERWARDPRFVQVYIDPFEIAPLGQRQYRPVLSAAARHGLPVALHVNRTPGMGLLTPVGMAANYTEVHPAYSMPTINHLTSMILEGAFDEFPELKIVLVEGGMAWAAPLMWRLDRCYEEFPGEVPLRRAPSEYLRTNVRITTQPIEEPDDLRHLQDYMRWMHAEETVLFSTDYPHWDFDNPRVTIARIPREFRDRVTHQNAIELYRLPAELPIQALVA